jgi:hypothetical protein
VKKLILFIAVISMHAHAQIGFYNPNDPTLSENVAKASESVFEIRTAFVSDLETGSDVLELDISTPAKKTAVLKKIDQLVIPYDKKDKQIFKLFIEKCEKEKDLKECNIPTSLNSGTGFITGNGKTFWTNPHVLEKTLNTKAEIEESTIADILLKGTKLPIFIFNSKGELIYNGLEYDALTFKATPQETLMSKIKKNFYAEDSDYIAINLPKELGTPLKVAQDNPMPGEKISILGYPYCTGCNAPEGMDQLEFTDRGQDLNAENCTQKVTTGSVLTSDEWGDLAEVNKIIVNMLDKKTFIGNTADSQHGMSGGPILNSAGEVIGIHSGGKSILKNGQHERYSRGVYPPALKLELNH